MAEDELAAFRARWKDELTSSKKEQRRVCGPSTSPDVPAQSNRYFKDLNNPSEACSPPGPGPGPDEDGGAAAESEDQPQYVSIARGLLDGRTSPLLDRIQEERTRRKRQYQDRTDVCRTSLQQEQPQKKVQRDQELLDQLIQDLVG